MFGRRCAIASHTPEPNFTRAQLQELNLEGCASTGDGACAAIAQRLVAVASLCLASCNRITDRGAWQLRTLLADGAAVLQRLDLSQCWNVHAETISRLRALPAACTVLYSESPN
jgi:hypothetical protein